MRDRYDMSGDFRYSTINIKSIVRDGLEIRIPWQLPPRPEHFTGREAELAQLLADLQPGRVVTLCGPGGIGKTALASEVVWQLAAGNEPPERFPDGIIFHSFYNQPQADLALEKIALAYGEEPRPTPRDAAQRALAGRQALLILDGSEAADNLPAVLEVRGQCGVIVTSRHRQDAVAERQDLSPLAPEAALKLLQAWGQEQVQDQAIANRICESVGGLPLAVRLVGRYLAETEETAGEYLEWLAETPLEALDPEGEQRRLQSVPWLLERSLAQVSEASQQLLAVVGHLALAPFAVAPVAEAMDLTLRATRRWLGELVSYGLLLRRGERYEVSHALIHTYARQRLEVLPEASSRLAAYYTAMAEAQSALGVEGYGRLDEERTHLMRVLVDCVEREDWGAAQNLAWAVDDYLTVRGYWTERVVAIDTGLVTAREVGDRRKEGSFLCNLGNAYRDLGEVERAIGYYEQALTVAQEIGHRKVEEAALGGLGVAYGDLGQAEQAIDYHQQALTIAQEIGDRRYEGIRLGNLGVAYHLLGQNEQAIDYFLQAQAIAREINDRNGKGYWLGYLGVAYFHLGEVERAIEYYEQALTVAQEIGHRRDKGIWLGYLGQTYGALEQVERAIGYYKQALTIAQEIGHRKVEEAALGDLGTAYSTLGKIDQAIVYYQQALHIAQQISDRRNEGIHLGNLGAAYSALGEMNKAIAYYKQALHIAQQISDRGNEGIWLGDLGAAYSTVGEVDQAIVYYQQALHIAQQIGDRGNEGIWLGSLGLVYGDLGQIDKARDYLTQALHIFEAIKSPYAEPGPSSTGPTR